ncbi:MAG: galactokinase [Solirubrobacterales bacterium]
MTDDQASTGPAEVRAFAPGRVNLIGEHTDYNRGLALPFAIAEGVTVRARAGAGERIRAHALDLREHDEFAIPEEVHAFPTPPHGGEWRAFVRGIAAELHRAGFAIPGADIEISGDLPRGAGLSSSAALEVALALALLGLAGMKLPESPREAAARAGHLLQRSAPLAGGTPTLDRRELARLCSHVENDWVGARTGLLDQLASLFGERDAALLIDFSDLDIEPVPLVLEDGWRLVTLDSGEPRALAASGYNERRAECARACELLGVESLREVGAGGPGGPPGALDPLLAGGLALEEMARLPPVLVRRVMHVLGENARVLATVAALRERDLPRVGALLDASHASLRHLYECSTPAVEAAVQRLKDAGALGARMVGGGFGGHVLGLLPPGATTPEGAHEVRPLGGAHLLAPSSH